ncbi:MAG: GxxExxY protein [Planctomycetota bacterium]
MNDDELNALMDKIIGFAIEVSNTLASGFPEKAYGNALKSRLTKLHCRPRIEVKRYPF